MYKIENGKLYRDGKETFCLGQSYYPSFNPTKFPVPPEGDRMGEMVKDLKGMADMGFNHVRFAALGEVTADLQVNTPFIDAMTEEAQKNDMSVSIREQGFSVNLRGFTDADMVDWNGAAPVYKWFDFIRSTLHHPGILEDNRVYAAALAKHYAQFPNVIAYQIYNEPHFPSGGMYDYHPETIKVYRKWLVEAGEMTAEEAENYEPPRGRKEQSPRMWALWRIFSRDSITNFLDNANMGSKAGSSLPTYTCYTGAPVGKGNVYKGCDLFANARSMDIAGFTSYYHACGQEYYLLNLQTDTMQCAAQLGGTQSWCIELDSRTYIPTFIYTRGTYTVLGSGCKGIVFYQWRGDYPAPGVPHPNSCGLLNYDGTKTANYENGAKVNRFIMDHNDLLMGAQKVHEGVGILVSDYAAFYSDALDNEDKSPEEKPFRNSFTAANNGIYRQLRQAGVSVSIVDRQGLEENPFGIRVLLIPAFTKLSAQEQATVIRFRGKGGKVYHEEEWGFRIFDGKDRTYEEKVFWYKLRAKDVLEVEGIVPKVQSTHPDVQVQLLQGQGYTLAVLTSLAITERETDVTLQVNIPFETAVFRDIDGEKPVTVQGNQVTIHDLTNGGILVLR